jgi:hypothetical protein
VKALRSPSHRQLPQEAEVFEWWQPAFHPRPRQQDLLKPDRESDSSIFGNDSWSCLPTFSALAACRRPRVLIRRANSAAEVNNRRAGAEADEAAVLPSIRHRPSTRMKLSGGFDTSRIRPTIAVHRTCRGDVSNWQDNLVAEESS